MLGMLVIPPSPCHAYHDANPQPWAIKHCVMPTVQRFEVVGHDATRFAVPEKFPDYSVHYPSHEWAKRCFACQRWKSIRRTCDEMPLCPSAVRGNGASGTWGSCPPDVDCRGAAQHSLAVRAPVKAEPAPVHPEPHS
jgi:hypothetical protein